MGLGIAYAGAENEQVKWFAFCLVIDLVGHSNFFLVKWTWPSSYIILGSRITWVELQSDLHCFLNTAAPGVWLLKLLFLLACKLKFASLVRVSWTAIVCLFPLKPNLSLCQIRSKLTPILNDAKAPLDVITFAAISLGLIYVGSCNEEVAQAIIFALMDRSDSELGEPLARLIPLSLGLLYLGKQVYFYSTGNPLLLLYLLAILLLILSLHAISSSFSIYCVVKACMY